jgi:DNA-binding LytR/AlgR family response regulator
MILINTQPAVMNDFSFFKVNGESINIFHSEIVYIQGANKYIRIVTEKKEYLSSATMKSALEMLPSDLFCQTHKSYIVCLGHVSKVGNNYLSVHDKRLPIGREYKKNILTKVISRDRFPKTK